MKTLFCYDSYGQDELFFFEVEGDYRHLHNAIINSNATDEQADEIDKIMCNEDCSYKVEIIGQPTKEWDYFVVIGHAP